MSPVVIAFYTGKGGRKRRRWWRAGWKEEEEEGALTLFHSISFFLFFFVSRLHAREYKKGLRDFGAWVEMTSQRAGQQFI